MRKSHERTVRDDTETRRRPEWPPPDWYVAENAGDHEGVLLQSGDARSMEHKDAPARPHRDIRY